MKTANELALAFEVSTEIDTLLLKRDKVISKKCEVGNSTLIVSLIDAEIESKLYVLEKLSV